MRSVKTAYKKVIEELKKHSPALEQRNLATMTSMIVSLLFGAKAQIPAMAELSPSSARLDAEYRRFQRFLSNENIDSDDVYATCFAQPLLQRLGKKRLLIALDASSVAKGCQVLAAGIVHKNRLLPLVWHTYPGKKGHASADVHLCVLRKLKSLLWDEADVCLLADGEYDSIEFLSWVQAETSWDFAIRTAKNVHIRKLVEPPKRKEEGEGAEKEPKRIDEVMNLKRGEKKLKKNMWYTSNKALLLNALGWWGACYREPLYLVSNMPNPEKLAKSYRKRFIIETLFSDQKGRGFGIDKSRLTHPKRIDRLMMITSMAYVCLVFHGWLMVVTGKFQKIEGKGRCDRSLFTLGKRCLNWLVKLGHRYQLCFVPQERVLFSEVSLPRRWET